MKQNDMVIVEREVHCPYCAQIEGRENNRNAILVNKNDGRMWSIGLPAFGLKWLLGLFYLNIIWIIRYGLKMFELTRNNKNSTYIFCPVCGNIVSANAPEEVKEEQEEPKLYRTRRNKCISGLSQGIADYLGISVIWVRFMNWLFILSGLYLILAMCIPFKEDVKKGIETGSQPFAKAVKGKWIFGICKGISNKYEISVVYIRILFAFLAITIIPGIIYLVFGLCCKREEDNHA